MAVAQTNLYFIAWNNTKIYELVTVIARDRKEITQNSYARYTIDERRLLTRRVEKTERESAVDGAQLIY